MSETLDDILTEMRNCANEVICPFAGGVRNCTDCLLKNYADRIEAARKRDAAPGNAAAMREALNQLRTWALMDINENAASADETNYKKLLDGIVEITNAALSAPARNCDVGTAEEQAERFHRYCRAHRTFFTECSASCPFTSAPDINHCQSGWAQLPFEAAKGGAE